MMIQLLKSKIHRATITQSSLDYEGSLAIDEDILDVSGILPYEKIAVLNISNGERLETYAIPDKRGSKVFSLNGAAAHKGKIGDRITVIAFMLVNSNESAAAPIILILDEKNRIIRKKKNS